MLTCCIYEGSAQINSTHTQEAEGSKNRPTLLHSELGDDCCPVHCIPVGILRKAALVVILCQPNQSNLHNLQDYHAKLHPKTPNASSSHTGQKSAKSSTFFRFFFAPFSPLFSFTTPHNTPHKNHQPQQKFLTNTLHDDGQLCNFPLALAHCTCRWPRPALSFSNTPPRDGRPTTSMMKTIHHNLFFFFVSLPAKLTEFRDATTGSGHFRTCRKPTCFGICGKECPHFRASTRNGLFFLVFGQQSELMKQEFLRRR